MFYVLVVTESGQPGRLERYPNWDEAETRLLSLVKAIIDEEQGREITAEEEDSVLLNGFFSFENDMGGVYILQCEGD